MTEPVAPRTLTFYEQTTRRIILRPQTGNPATVRWIGYLITGSPRPTFWQRVKRRLRSLLVSKGT